MQERQDAEAVLITGVFGAGKSSVAAEIAGVLEELGGRYAALDLDWLAWADPGSDDEDAELRMMLANVASILDNYLAIGIRRFVLAGAILDRAELEGLRTTLAMPMTVVRLTVPVAEIEERLRADVTTQRMDDLREAAAWLERGHGEGVEDLTIANAGPIREVALAILTQLGWG